jgi:hypothetical protein
VNCYPFIEAEKLQRRNVKRAYELLKVSRSAYYAACRDEPSDRAAQDAGLAARVKAVHEESKGRYGAPRVHAQLRAQGRRHSRKRIVFAANVHPSRRSGRLAGGSFGDQSPSITGASGRWVSRFQPGLPCTSSCGRSEHCAGPAGDQCWGQGVPRAWQGHPERHRG